MKRLFTLLTAAFITTAAFALDYDEARRQAWFLTDKMAYELNLTPDQYDRAYEINLDYLLHVNKASNCYGRYWSYRNADLRCILYDWQYNLYLSLDYFYRPIRWVNGWFYPIFNHYRQGYYYFERPRVYVHYSGRNWRRRGHNDVSPYHGFHIRPGHGMRDNYRGNNGHPGKPNRYDPPKRQDKPQVAPGHNQRPSGGNVTRPQRPNSGNNRPGNQNNRPSSGNRPNVGKQNQTGNASNRPSVRPNRNNSNSQGNASTNKRPERQLGR